MHTNEAVFLNSKLSIILLRCVIQAPFTRCRFHFISDWVRQSDMKISHVYTMPFSFHIGLGKAIRYENFSCLYDAVFISYRIG